MNNWLHWGKSTADKTPNCYSARRSKGRRLIFKTMYGIRGWKLLLLHQEVLIY